MEEVSDSEDTDVTNVKAHNKNGKGHTKQREKKISRKNSDLSKSKRSVKRRLKKFSFGNWQKSLSKKKNKKRIFNLDQETCRSSSSIVSDSSVETVTCVCTGYRQKVVVEENPPRKNNVVSSAQTSVHKNDLASSSSQNSLPNGDTANGTTQDSNSKNSSNTTSNTAIKADNSSHEEATYQDTQEASNRSLTRATRSRPRDSNEIDLSKFEVVIRNHFGLPYDPGRLIHYTELGPSYRPSNISHISPHVTIYTQIDYIHHLVPGLSEITNCSFYWGKMDRYKAEKQLENKPEGTFLLRDSAHDEFLFSVSFRRYDRTLHARIEQLNHKFSFDSHDPNVFASSTVCGLLEHYKNPRCCMFFEPMLTLPMHRTFPFDLQHICRSVIADHVTYDSISLLKLPRNIKSYLREYYYKQKIRVRQFENDFPFDYAKDILKF